MFENNPYGFVGVAMIKEVHRTVVDEGTQPNQLEQPEAFITISGTGRVKQALNNLTAAMKQLPANYLNRNRVKSRC